MPDKGPGTVGNLGLKIEAPVFHLNVGDHSVAILLIGKDSLHTPYRSYPTPSGASYEDLGQRRGIQMTASPYWLSSTP